MKSGKEMGGNEHIVPPIIDFIVVYLLTSSMRHPNYNSLINNLKERPDGEVFLGKK